MVVRTGSPAVRIGLSSSPLIWVTVLAAGLVGLVPTPPANASGNTPPFTQCPKVGASDSCEILLVVSADRSVSVLGDPSVGPYDGGDDTLVGIQNDSSSEVDAITVTGPGSDLSGFDGDGICTYTFSGDSYCSSLPSGSTGYEGPDTSFVTDPSVPDSAEVDFASGGLGPSQHT